VAELSTTHPGVTAVLGSAEACELVSALPGACPISPVEVAIVGDASITALRQAVQRVDPDAVVRDVSDGWVLHTLRGPGAREAFARLSELELPASGSVQGAVARVGVRVLLEGDRVDLLVPSMLATHVLERIEDECRELLA
jgi:sarcosine oxidase gamma subunit